MFKLINFQLFFYIFIIFNFYKTFGTIFSLKYPEYRVKPTTILQNYNNQFSITGFTISNSNNHVWWRWFMPHFAKEHYFGKNLTTQNNINDKYICHLRMIGMYSELQNEYNEGGYGFLTILNSKRSIQNLKCYYITRFEYVGSHRIAIYCPILNPKYNIINSSFSSTQTLKQQHNRNDLNNLYHDKEFHQQGELCRQFLSLSEVSVNVTLFPSISSFKPKYNKKIYKPPKEYYNSSSLLSLFTLIRKEKENDSIITLRPEDDLLYKKDSNSNIKSESVLLFNKPRYSSQHRIVITIQVFYNVFSVSNMHIFIQHYAHLNFTIVIFDRFGLHYGIVKQYFQHADIKYHPYSILELIQPHIYNETYKSLINRNYTFYYEHDKLGDSDSLLSDTITLDLDKQITFDSARLEYSHSIGLLFADIDELLFSIPNPTKTIQFVEEDYVNIAKMTENFKIQRFNVAGKTSNLKLRGTNKTDRLLIPKIEKCLKEGLMYNNSNVNVTNLLDCYAGPVYSQIFPKYVDTLGICPFSWNHGSCGDFNSKTINTPELLSQTVLSNQQIDCFCLTKRGIGSLQLVHLSHQGYFRSLGRFRLNNVLINQTINPLIEYKWY